MITYSKVGGPPVNWHNLKVIDLDTGKEITNVIEVDCEKEWLLRYPDKPIDFCAGDPECAKCSKKPHIRTERLTGNFTLIDVEKT